MEKLVFSLVCVLLCSACGAALAKDLKKRKALLDALAQDLRSIRGWILFERLPLGALFTRLRDSELKPLWTEAAKAAEGAAGSFAESWKSCVEREKKLLLCALSEEDLEILLEFGIRLCALPDTQAQRKQIDLTLERLARCAGEAKEEIQKKGKLLQSLGTLGGLAVAIVLW